MNKEQYLLTCLAEECAEVAHRAAKAIRFGLNEKQRDQDKTNAERLKEELCDLYSLVVMLEDGYIQPIQYDEIQYNKKRDKVEKYLKYSRELGQAV